MLKALHTLNKHNWIDFVEYIQLVEVLDIMWALEINALDLRSVNGILLRTVLHFCCCM